MTVSKLSKNIFVFLLSDHSQSRYSGSEDLGICSTYVNLQPSGYRFKRLSAQEFIVTRCGSGTTRSRRSCQWGVLTASGRSSDALL